MLAAADLLGCTSLYEVAPKPPSPFLPVLAWLLCWPADFLAKRSTSQAEAACTGTKMTGPNMGTVISNIWGARNALMVNSLSLQHHQHLISTPHLPRQHQRLIYIYIYIYVCTIAQECISNLMPIQTPCSKVSIECFSRMFCSGFSR